jgi:hypothetical protein
MNITPPDKSAIRARVQKVAQVRSMSELPEQLHRAGLSLEVLLPHWYDILIPTLAETLREQVAGTPKIDVGEDPLDAHIHVWLAIGEAAIQSGQPTFGRDLFTALLAELRALQPTHGRVHKGTPYHEIGVALLTMGDRAGAERYFTFAAIEDLISTHGDAAGLDTPASQTLRAVYQRETDYFEGLAAQLDDLQPPGVPIPENTLKLENPELLFIESRRTVNLAPPANESE